MIMLAFWVWAIVFWIRGIEKDERISLASSALFVTLCALTKYYGISLVGLLFIYTLAKKRRLGSWLVYLLVPIAALIWYEFTTETLYGIGLFSKAGRYAFDSQTDSGNGIVLKGLIGLSFTGGCLAVVFFYLPFLWRRRTVILQVFIFIAMAATAVFMKRIGGFPTHNQYGAIRWAFVIQFALFTLVGVNIIALAVTDLIKNRRSPEAILLFLWIAGTFIFASFVNWTVNARSILPMAPAVGILLMRRSKPPPAWPLVPALIVALLVAWADYGLANSARSAVDIIYSKYRDWPGKARFQGHWGFQYYMELKGFEIDEQGRSDFLPGDILIIPENNCDYYMPPPDVIISPLETIEAPAEGECEQAEKRD